MLQFNASYILNAQVESLVRNYNKFSFTSITVKPECPQIRLSPKISNSVPIKISSKMDPKLLKISADVRDGCIDPQIINLGLEWSVNIPDTSYNKSNDSKAIQFKEFPAGTRYIYISVKLLFRKINDPLA